MNRNRPEDSRNTQLGIVLKLIDSNRDINKQSDEKEDTIHILAPYEE